MTVFRLDPLTDSRWPAFAARHPDASVFHTRAWLEALRRTYGYVPIAFTTTPPEQSLENGIVFCRINSWLTGTRLVSLPFSDHCDPLLALDQDAAPLVDAVSAASAGMGCAYMELRPRRAKLSQMGVTASYVFHHIDLAPSVDDLFAALHKSTIQRNVRRAARAGLEYEHGNSMTLCDKLYALLVLTRRRHGLPPQPRRWFTNLLASFGDTLQLHLASAEGRPVAGILSLSHRSTMVYKYGASDARFHHLGSMPFLFWKLIQAAKASGMDELDLGRSDVNNAGLIAFKTRLGGTASTLEYVRNRPADAGFRAGFALARLAVERAPDFLLTAAGRVLYRHIG